MTFQWYLTPLGGVEQLISGATASQYTVRSVGCAQRGIYRADAKDGCGKTFFYTANNEAGLNQAGCP